MSITGSEQWMYSSGVAGFYDFPIEQSLRFNDNDSAYLSRTPASAGNRKTWTWSGWVKRGGAFTSNQSLFSSATNYDDLRFSTNGELLFVGGTSGCTIATTSVYRDPSAWMSIILSYNSTEATSSDRVKLYVNGEQVTSLTTAIYPALNRELDFNNTVAHAIGRRESTDNLYADLYLADVNFIDGQALDPTSFGQFKSGIFIPKDTSGLTFGTNGFRLQFGDSAAIGDDTSGNTNDWTVNNLVASDVVLDSPTNNFGVMSSIDKGDGTATYSEGNLKVSVGDNEEAFGSFGMSSGKWYWEIRYVSSAAGNNKIGLGIADTANPNNNEVTNNGHQGTTYAPNDILAVAVDVDSELFSFYKNGTIIETDTDWSAKGWDSIKPIVTSSNSSGEEVCILNFGQDDTFAGAISATGNTDENGQGVFKYAPPSGFLSLCSANLPTGAIDTLADETPEDYFNTVLYTGNQSDGHAISGVGFSSSPDFVWIKERSSTSSHLLVDAVRGATKGLASNATSVEENLTAGEFVSFDSDGFTVDNNNRSNQSGQTYVAWNWKAGGSGVSNTDGSITSTVSVSETGDGTKWFSVVGFTTQAGGYTVGHGLGQKPSLIITKNRDTAGGAWYTFTDIIDGSVDYLALNQTSAKLNDPFGLANPTSSVFSLDDDYIFGSGDCIAYCFANAEGLCRAGSYVGNGSADGVFVYTGHRSSFLLIKETGNANSWELFDTARDPDNVASQRLFPNTSAAEATTNPSLDILSNGFKARAGNTGINRSGGSYIFLSISEQPFKYANAR